MKKMSPKTFREWAELSLKNYRQMKQREAEDRLWEGSESNPKNRPTKLTEAEGSRILGETQETQK